MDALFHNKTAAARGVAHEKPLAIAHNDAAMKDIEIFARGREEDQIARLQRRLNSLDRRLRYTFDADSLRAESRHDVQNA